MKNALQLLQVYGQSVWLDYLRRSLITSGELKRLIEEDGLRGLTSNPSIFEKAIAESKDYADILDDPASQGNDAKTLYERIAVRDIQDAADLFRPVYLESKWRDGYVSLEVSPLLAHDTDNTLREARRLWQAVGRENLMIKVPATIEGVPAVQQLISEGINVNCTLIFAQDTYEQVAAAYLRGLETCHRNGGQIAKVASVASFFISRIDAAVDHWIAERLKTCEDPGVQTELRSLLGKAAIASAKLAYQDYLSIVQGEHWQELKRHGAQTQRLLWASTGTKNPDYRDVVYVEELIGPDTVNTIPPATMSAFCDHGRDLLTLTENVEEAKSIMDLVQQVGIPFKEITDHLLREGVKQFKDAFIKLLMATDRSGEAADIDPVEYLRIEMMKALYRG